MHSRCNLSIARFVFSNMGIKILAKKRHFELSKLHGFPLVKGVKNAAAKYLRKGCLYLFH